MPTVTKTTLIFQVTTQPLDPTIPQRTAGWSESLWSDGGLDAAEEKLGLTVGSKLVGTRAALLSNDAVLVAARMQSFEIKPEGLLPITGVRLRKVGRKGPVSFNKADGGGAPNTTDVPGAALMLAAPLRSPATQTIRWTLRGIPDEQLAFGEASFSPAFKTALTTYMRYVSRNYGSVVDNRAVPIQPVARITAGGIVFPGAPPFTDLIVNAMVKINQTKDGCGKRLSALAKVKTVNADGSITLWKWKHEVGTTGGTIFLWSRMFARFGDEKVKLVRAVDRKVGLPFARYHGRLSPLR